MGESELVVMQTTNIKNPVLEDGAMVTSDATLDSTSLVTTKEVCNVAEGPVNSHLGSAVDVANTSEKTSDFGNAAEASNQIASSESVACINGVPESQNFSLSESHENGVSSIEAQGAMTERHFEGSSALSVEEDRLWNIVRANSLDFNAWTALIQETEKISEDNILKIRKIYDAFLAEFPLCYGYWKKYADHEARLGGIDKIVEVYERAVQAVTYSVDIWLHYCVFATSTFGDSDSIRRLFERGLAYVGSDYLSYPLWDKYIEYEYSHQVWSHLAMIYTRILENPIQQLDRYFNSFKELAASRPLSELRTPEEKAMLTPHSESGNHGVNNESHAESLDQSPKPMRSGLTEAEEFEKYVAIREEMYKKAKEFDSKILDFETAITRPYFHVKPLDEQQLENWHAYLDFIEGGDDFNKVVKLYERCLIACANYPEFWIRYTLCMEASGSTELANNALARATQVFVKRQPEIHLFAARFKEYNGDISGARAEYQQLHSEISPGLFEAIVKHANMEYRLGNVEAAFSVYTDAIAIEQGKEQSLVLPMLVVQYSRFIYLVVGNVEKSREVLHGAFTNIPLSKPLLEALIHFESVQSFPKRIDYLDSLVEKFITPSSESMASMADREELSCIYLEFLDLFGDVQSIKKADNRHAKMFLRQRNLSESKKRQAEEFLTSEKTKLAKSFAGMTPSGQSGVGGAYSSSNPWTTSYGQQIQSWPQTSQSQGQQWNSGYAHQAGYSGYAAYGGYSAQVPTLAPPTASASAATYSAYPSTFSVQPGFQPGYAQPTQATLMAPQQAPAPQAYYGSYY